MRSKAFILGAGCGIICMTVALFFFYTVNISRTVNAEDAPADEVIIERARELGMVFYMDFVRSEDKVGQQTAPPITDDEIIQRARELGMEFAAEQEASPEPDSFENPEPAEPAEEITIHIPNGMTGLQIARLLYENGVIDNASAFSSFMTDKGLSKDMRSGNYTFMLNSDYEDVAERLRRGR